MLIASYLRISTFQANYDKEWYATCPNHHSLLEICSNIVRENTQEIVFLIASSGLIQQGTPTSTLLQHQAKLGASFCSFHWRRQGKQQQQQACSRKRVGANNMEIAAILQQPGPDDRWKPLALKASSSSVSTPRASARASRSGLLLK